ncbi:MAG: S9 family peptidase [Verrucomicrobia bacterium]|nr:S9 family peptidase [Verrucomicrobiota bacterium]
MFTFLLRSSRVLPVAAALGTAVHLPAETLTQPVAPVRPVTDNYFGTVVTDNYRWMEDLKSPEVQKWMKEQAAYTKDYLGKLPGRDALLKRIEALDNAATRVPEVQLHGTYYFYLKTNATDQTPKLYVRDGPDATERPLVDPQVLGGGEKRFTISAFYPSPDGRFVAVEIAAGGSEEGVVHVLDVATGKPLKDKIDRVWESSVSWVSNDKCFFYSRLQKLEPGMTELDKELNEAAYLHRLGDDPEMDTPVLGSKFNPPVPMLPTDSGFVTVPPDSHYGFGTIFHGVQNEITLLCSPIEALTQGKPSWTKICDVDDGVVGFDARGNDLFLQTHKDAPRFKIIHVDLQHPDIAKADVVVPQSDLVIKNVGTAKDALYVQAAQTGIGRVLRVAYGQSESQQIQLPFVGAVAGFATNPQADGVLLRLAGWVEAPGWYAYNPGTNQVIDTRLEPQNPADFSGITAVEVTAPGADGTPIPLSIIYKKDLKMDGSNPCLMEGYGAYGITIDPEFQATQLALLERGVVVAFAHVRGGGENGEDWHLAGQKLTKQNTISDFIACAEYLIRQGYTSPRKLALRGTSAGGITIGGALTQRPDLFALAIVNVGVVNPLRAEAEPNGAVNAPEFGSVKDPDGFKALYAMDAYQHVKDGTPYPAVLLITGANDPRVDPVELFKMTARLQAATSSKNPVLLRVDPDAGHGVGSSKQQHDLITADQAALLLSLAANRE